MASLHPILLFALVAVLSLTGCGKSAQPGADAATGPAAPASSARLLLAAEDVLTLSASTHATGPVITGSLQPERRADLRAEVGATVQQVLKDNGEPVRKGDLLVRLDDTALRESLASASEAVRAANQAFEQAQRQAQRQRTLQTQGMISLQALEDAEVRRNSAQSELVAARAREASARQQLRRTEVRAPFDGVLSERKVSAGDTASVGKELLKVMDPSSMRLEGLVSADRMGELRPRQAVRFRINGFAGQEFAGTVRRIDADADAATRQVSVIVDFADAAKAPRVAGLYAEGRVETGAAQALLLPEGALQRAGETAHAWRVQGAQIQRVAVKLGPRDARSGEYAVLAGLAAGDRVLRNPGSLLVDGQAVEWAKPAAAEAASAASATAASAASAGASR